jgi:hypothetical protein
LQNDHGEGTGAIKKTKKKKKKKKGKEEPTENAVPQDETNGAIALVDGEKSSVSEVAVILWLTDSFLTKIIR